MKTWGKETNHQGGKCHNRRGDLGYFSISSCSGLYNRL